MPLAWMYVLVPALVRYNPQLLQDTREGTATDLWNMICAKYAPQHIGRVELRDRNDPFAMQEILLAIG